MGFKNLKTIYFFLKDYKRYVLGISIFSMLFAFFEGLNVVVLFPIISSVLKQDAATGQASGVIRILNAVIRTIPVGDTFIAACIFVIIIVVYMCSYTQK